MTSESFAPGEREIIAVVRGFAAAEGTNDINGLVIAPRMSSWPATEYPGLIP